MYGIHTAREPDKLDRVAPNPSGPGLTAQESGSPSLSPSRGPDGEIVYVTVYPRPAADVTGPPIMPPAASATATKPIPKPTATRSPNGGPPAQPTASPTPPAPPPTSDPLPTTTLPPTDPPTVPPTTPPVETGGAGVGGTDNGTGNAPLGTDPASAADASAAVPVGDTAAP
jgi:hypothetical protein